VSKVDVRSPPSMIDENDNVCQKEADDDRDVESKDLVDGRRKGCRREIWKIAKTKTASTAS